MMEHVNDWVTFAAQYVCVNISVIGQHKKPINPESRRCQSVSQDERQRGPLNTAAHPPARSRDAPPPAPKEGIDPILKVCPAIPNKIHSSAASQRRGAPHWFTRRAGDFGNRYILPISVFFVAFILIWGKNNSTFLITNFQVRLIWRKNYWLALKTVMSYNLKNLNV